MNLIVSTQDSELFESTPLVMDIPHSRVARRISFSNPEPPTQECDMMDFLCDYDDWICGICQEGDSNYGARTRHACGHHEFHTQCLADMQIRDIRCAICRYPPDAPSPNFSQSQATVFVFSQSTQSVLSSPDSQSTPILSPRYALFRQNALFARPSYMIPREQDVARVRPSYEEVHDVEDYVCVHCRLPLWQYTNMMINVDIICINFVC